MMIAALTLLASVMMALPAPAASADDSATSDASVLCRFDDKRLAEISGLALSNRHEGIIWAHSDSGGGPRIYALDIATCEVEAVLTMRGVPARDMEAMAAGVNAIGERVLWVGDIGDNTGDRSSVSLYEVKEPSTLESRSVSATRYRVKYSRPQDAEALVADPSTQRLWIITKGLLGGSVWQLPVPFRPGPTIRLDKVGDEEGFVTDAAMAPDGSMYVVRDYTEARVYRGQPPGRLVARLPLPEQVQGEAVTWAADGRSLIVASESDDRLLGVGLPEKAWMVSARPKDVAAGSTAEVASGVGTESGSTGQGTNALSSAVVPADRVGSLAVVALAAGAVAFTAATLIVIGATLWRSRRGRT